MENSGFVDDFRTFKNLDSKVIEIRTSIRNPVSNDDSEKSVSSTCAEDRSSSHLTKEEIELL